MNTDDLRGVWVAMPTPWSAAGAIDAVAVTELVSRYAAGGIHGTYTTGTDGEMHVLDLPDFRGLAEAFGRATADSGIPAQMGCTWSHTQGVIERARIAQANGISTIQVALPSWVVLSDLEMLRFFEQLATALPDIRLVHYNIANAGRFLTGSDYRAILEVAPTLVGSKHTGGNVSSLIEITQETPHMAHFVVDGQIVPGAMFGARGFYSFVANLSPKIALDLWSFVERGDWQQAADLRAQTERLFRTWRATLGTVRASPAMAKIATRAGVFAEMPLDVRSPYIAGEQLHVDALRSLVQSEMPDYAAMH